MEAVEERKYKGYNISIHYDEDPESPREWDNLETMTCFHSRYNLGDEHNYKNPSTFLYDIISDYEDIDEIEFDFNEMSMRDFIDKYLEKMEKYYIVLPLYLYDHSGITMNTKPFSCPWDSGQVGLIYVSNEKAKEEYGWKTMSKSLRNRIIKYLEGEVKTYDQFLTGQVYGYTIEKYGEIIDSCWGFYGNYEGYMMKEIESIIDYHYEKDQKEIAEIHEKEIE